MIIPKIKKQILRMTHGFMIYECEVCKSKYRMWIETGLEDYSIASKPVPYLISCLKCKKGLAKDVSGLISLNRLIPIENDMYRFENHDGKECGIATEGKVKKRLLGW